MDQQTKIATLERQNAQLKEDITFLNTMLASRDQQLNRIGAENLRLNKIIKEQS